MSKPGRLLLAIQTATPGTNYRNAQIVLPGQIPSYVKNRRRVVNLFQYRWIALIVKTDYPDAELLSQLQLSGNIEFGTRCGDSFLKPTPLILASSLTEAPNARSTEPKCFINFAKVLGPTCSALINLSHFSISTELGCGFAILSFSASRNYKDTGTRLRVHKLHGFAFNHKEHEGTKKNWTLFSGISRNDKKIHNRSRGVNCFFGHCVKRKAESSP
jgi:hypothetical protein